MKNIGFLALLLGTSVTAFASVVPQEVMPKTPVRVVDTSVKEIMVEVPEKMDYTEELKDSRFDNVRQLEGMENAKYVRNFAKMLRDNPQKLMKQVYNVDASSIDMSAYEGKKALGTQKEAVGVAMKDKGSKDVNWVDSLADVRFPEFVGDYNDLKDLQAEFKEQNQKGLEEIKKLDFKKQMRMAPIRQAV